MSMIGSSALNCRSAPEGILRLRWRRSITVTDVWIRIQFDVIGSLDADISLDDPEYFAFLIDKLHRDPVLGVTGTPFTEEWQNV
jgi:hypothetical protein